MGERPPSDRGDTGDDADASGEGGRVSETSIPRQLELLTTVARRLGTAVVVTSPSGAIEWVNEGFTRLTGYAPEAIAGRDFVELLRDPDAEPGPLAAMARAFASGGAFDEVVLCRSRDAQQRWVRIDAEPTRDAEQRITGFIAIETDVTEQRIAEGRERVTKGVGDRLLDCRSVEEAAAVVVEELVGALDVRAAQAWLVEPGMPNLRYLVGRRGKPGSERCARSRCAAPKASSR